MKTVEIPKAEMRIEPEEESEELKSSFKSLITDQKDQQTQWNERKECWNMTSDLNQYKHPLYKDLNNLRHFQQRK